MKTKFLKRERIRKALTSIYDFPLTIITAPIGYGKSTAVRDFIESEEIQSIWISMKNSDESPGYVWESFSEEIGKLDEESGETIKGLGFPQDVPQREKILSILNRIELETTLFFVINDFHLVGNTQTEKLVMRIAEERIENLHLVLITTDTTTLDIEELISKGTCQVITQEILKFTEEEVREYCTMVLENISYKDINRICQYTDGWISLIYMLLLGLKQGISVGMNLNVDRLVEKTIFNNYDERVRRLLLELSVMDSFTVEQAIFITEDKKIPEVLWKLHKENSFVYYDEGKKRYRIHNVLLDFLRKRQVFDETENQEICHRLGEWYLKNGELVNAYGYFYKAGEIERILSLLNDPKNIRPHLGIFEGSEEMFRNTAVHLLEKYPIAYLQFILDLLLHADENSGPECFRRLNSLDKVYKESEGIDQRYRNRILAEINIIRKVAGFSDPRAFTKNDELTIELLDGEQSYIFFQGDKMTFGSPHLLYNHFQKQGTLKNRIQEIMERFVLYPQYTSGSGTGGDYLTFAEYSLETGHWQNAELNSFKAIYKARTKKQFCIIICANFNLMRLYIFQGKVNEALEMLKQLEQEIGALNDPVLNTTVDICKGYIYGNLGQLEKIPYWLQVGDMDNANFMYKGVAFNYLTYGKAVLASKNYVKLEVLSESFNEHFAIFHNQLGFIHNSIFNSVAKYKLYGMNEGIKALKEALKGGMADDIVLPFVENAPHIIEMLKSISDKSTKGYIKKVFSLSEQYLGNIKNVELLKITLTLREKEVLSLVAEGISREEIANSLMIAPGTVKTHIQNIYQKLEVNGKSEAVKTAIKNGLL